MILPVQTCADRLDNSASAVTPAFGSNVAAGNLIVVGVVTYNSAAITVTVTDSLGNTYTQIGSYSTSSPQRASLWYAKNITGGACTATVTPSAASYTRVFAREYSGASTTAPLDSSATNTGSTAPMSTGTVTVTDANSLLVGVFGWTSGSGEPLAGGAASLAGMFTGSGVLACFADRQASVNGTVTVSVGSASYCAAGASFVAVPVSGGGGLLRPASMAGGF